MADLAVERAELKADDKGEHKELMAIYVARGLDPSLAKQVAQQLMAHAWPTVTCALFYSSTALGGFREHRRVHTRDQQQVCQSTIVSTEGFTP